MGTASARIEQHDGLGSVLRADVARPERRTPAPHGERSRVEWTQLLHPCEEPGVTCEVDASRPLDHVAQGRSALAEQEPSAVVQCGDGDDAYAAERDDVALDDLGHVVEVAPSEERSGDLRYHERDVAPEQLERGQIEVVEVLVRDQDGVDVGRRLGRKRHGSSQVGNPTA